MIKLIKKLWIRFRPTARGAIALSCVLTLVGLAFMVWSLLKPSAMPVILFMSIGQGLGILAFALFGYAVLLDLLRVRRERRATSMELPVIRAEDKK